MMHSYQPFTCGTQLWFAKLSLFHIQSLRGEHPLKEPVGSQCFYEQSFCPLSLVAARLHSSLPRMPLITFPKCRKKLPCVRIASVFAHVKLKIYSQPPFPCPVVSNMTQKTLPISPSHQKQSLISTWWTRRYRAVQFLSMWIEVPTVKAHLLVSSPPDGSFQCPTLLSFISSLI